MCVTDSRSLPTSPPIPHHKKQERLSGTLAMEAALAAGQGQNVFSYQRMCSLTIEISGALAIEAALAAGSARVREGEKERESA